MKKTILIADDEASLRYLLAETLEIQDYEIIEAEDGEEALYSIINRFPDLIILDVMMPKMTGYQVLEEMEKRKGVKRPMVIMLTAKAQQYDKEKGLKTGADYYLPKPFSPLELLDLVENIFSGN